MTVTGCLSGNLKVFRIQAGLFSLQNEPNRLILSVSIPAIASLAQLRKTTKSPTSKNLTFYYEGSQYKRPLSPSVSTVLLIRSNDHFNDRWSFDDFGNPMFITDFTQGYKINRKAKCNQIGGNNIYSTAFNFISSFFCRQMALGKLPIRTP